MPITQDQMIAQMQESRAALQCQQRLRDSIRAYVVNARERNGGKSKELDETLYAILLLIDQEPIPSQHVTYYNERYYQRRAKANNKSRVNQEQMRRAKGIRTREEYNRDKGNLDNVSREMKRELFAHAMPTPGELIPTYQERKAASGPKPIMPRDFADDKDLEFDTPIASPDDIQNNFAMGLGLGLDTTSQDDSIGNGNSAKEQEK